MAEYSRSKFKMEQIEDAIAKLTSNQLNYATVQNHVTVELDELLQWIFAIENNQHSPNSSSSTNPHSPASPSPNPHLMKLEVPCFDGTNPSGWIFKITQFFEYHVTPDHERFTIVSFYMEGMTLAWFQWMMCNGQI